MERRDFAKAAAGVLGAGLLAGCGEGPGARRRSAAVQTRTRVQWRLTSSFGRSLDAIYGPSEILVQRVAALTDGLFEIRAYPAPEIVPPLQVMDAVQQGTVHVGQTAGYYYTGKNPALAFDTTIPFGLNARGQNAWLWHGGGLERMRELYADFNIINFPSGNTGAQMGGWFRRPLGSLRELSGLKMRIPGLGGAVMTRLGVSVQNLAGGDIFPALERGAIDATEFVGPYDDEKLGFFQVAKHYYYPGWWEPGAEITFLVNRTAWDALPRNYQEVFQSAAREASSHMLATYDARNPAALDRLLGHGVQLHPFPEDIMLAGMRESAALQEELASADSTYRRILAEWRAFRAQNARWFQTTDQTYENFAFPRVGGR
ncbi:MAG: TRAP transporter substrate-binding protein [Gemmatimonadetes bacterium]|nr:TRAP transporter substrate-binding protein [Gemmatimonadota bacterium]